MATQNNTTGYFELDSPSTLGLHLEAGASDGLIAQAHEILATVSSSSTQTNVQEWLDDIQNANNTLLSNVSSSGLGSDGKTIIYVSSNKALTASSATVGSTTKPVYLNSGTITALSGTVGSSTKPVYLSHGTVTASTSTVGSSNTIMYMLSGELTSGTTFVRISSSSISNLFVSSD